MITPALSSWHRTVQAALKIPARCRRDQFIYQRASCTFIDAIDYPQLCALAGQDIIVGGMPLPYSRRYEGLASGINKAFSHANLGINLLFCRGSLNRIKTLMQGRYDFIVLSKYACDSARAMGWKIKGIFELGIETYVGQHTIFCADQNKQSIENGMKIGIDPDSIDRSTFARSNERSQSGIRGNQLYEPAPRCLTNRSTPPFGIQKISPLPIPRSRSSH